MLPRDFVVRASTDTRNVKFKIAQETFSFHLITPGSSFDMVARQVHDNLAANVQYRLKIQ